jgi:hypothetical protein
VLGFKTAMIRFNAIKELLYLQDIDSR